MNVVFTEELVSPAVSRTLAESAGASTESIDTLESSDDKSSYVERMRRNLEKNFESHAIKLLALS